MKFKRNEIIAALDAVAPGLANREVLTQAQSFVFYNGKVWTFNDMLAVSHPLPDGWEVEAAVKAQELHRVIKKMDSEEVDISLASDGNELIIATPTDRLGMKVESEVTKHHESIGEPSEWLELPADFMDALTRASLCTSRNMSFPLLMHVHVKGNKVEAVDNSRLLVQEIEADMPEFLVPREAVNHLAKYKCTAVGLSDGWVHFRNNDDVMFSTRTMAPDEFMNLEPLLNVEGTRVAFPKELKGGIDKAVDVLDMKDALPFIEVAASKGVLTIKAEGPAANLKERYRVTFKDELRFTIHPELFADALGVGVECVIGEKAISIVSAEKHFTHVLALVVMGSGETTTEPAAEPEAEAPKPAAKAKKIAKAPAAATTEDTGW